MHQRQSKQNASLTPSEVESYCSIDDKGMHLLTQAISKLGLSARSYQRILKVARTIADLAGRDGIASMHVAEAIGYRRVLSHG
jgi:magnesium chelatase family protein